jgi:uncharacterized protein (TIGR03435 family)
MNNSRRNWHRSCFISLSRFAIAAVLFIAANKSVTAQQQNETITTFDVASIRPFKLNENSFIRTISNNPHVGSFRATAVTVKVLLHLAYDIEENQIQGGPGWLDADLYDIEAKSDRSVDERLQKMSDEDAKKSKQHMLQELLAERFNLKVHTTTRSGTVYVLVQTKSGVKMTLSPPIPADDAEAAKRLAGMHIENGIWVFQQMPFPNFVHLLSETTHQDLIDKTGLTGTYNFSLRFQSGLQRADSDSTVPTLEDALPDQLGLKIEGEKGQVETLVIDHIEKPSPN